MIPTVSSEKGTQAYYFFQNPESPDTISGIELYDDQSAMMTHGTSPEFKGFVKKFRPSFSKKLELKLFKPAHGFLSRSNGARLRNQETSCIVVIATVTLKQGVRAAFLQKAENAAASVQANEPDTYSYLFNTSLASEDEVMVFERYADDNAIKAHLKNPDIKKMMRETKDMIAKATEMKRYSPINVGFLHKEASQSKL